MPITAEAAEMRVAAFDTFILVRAAVMATADSRHFAAACAARVWLRDAARVRMVSDELRAQLRDGPLYRVADNAPASALVDKLSVSQNLNACNGCELEIGRKLGTERVGVCWVQKIGNLIININLACRGRGKREDGVSAKSSCVAVALAALRSSVEHLLELCALIVGQMIDGMRHCKHDMQPQFALVARRIR